MTTEWNTSRAARGLIALVLVSLLGACATFRGKSAPEEDYGSLMEQAEVSVRSGQVDDALVAFADAAKADPTQKEPWVRVAQLEFDRAYYARAIVAAEEAMQRDPDDLVADSILTVSGFRIANHALQRLEGRGALASETARREAETLATTLRETMGTAILDEPEAEPEAAPRRRTARRPQQRRTPAPAAQPAAEAPASGSSSSSGSSDPFKNIGGN